MKIGVSSYCFKNLVETGRMHQLDVISKAKEIGFDAIEFTRFILPDGETPHIFAAKVKEECEKVNIDIVNYAIPADFINGSQGDLQAEVDRLKEDLKVAQILGSPCMRHDVSVGFKNDYPGPRRFDDALPILVKGCREVTKIAEDKGIRTLVENHGRFFQDSERVESLVNEVNNPNFGILLDIGNFICVDEDPVAAVGRLIPYAAHIHVKDFNLKSGMQPFPGYGWKKTRGNNYFKGTIIGHGDIPVIQCLKIIKNTGYDDVLSIEFEGIEDPIIGTSEGLKNIRRFLDLASE